VAPAVAAATPNADTAASAVADHYSAAGHRASKAPPATLASAPSQAVPASSTTQQSVEQDTARRVSAASSTQATATQNSPATVATPTVAPVVVTDPSGGTPTAAAGGKATAPARAAPRRPAAPDPGVVALANAERLLAARDFRQARLAADAAIAASPRVPGAYAVRARVRLQQGEIREAWADAEMAARLGDFWSAQTATAIVERRAGDTTSARNRVNALVRLASDGRRTLEPREQIQLAMALAAVDDRDRALAMLESVKPASGAELRLALQDPGFDSLRGTSRFQALVDRSRRSGGTRATRRGS
jgi:hypothetical protein